MTEFCDIQKLAELLKIHRPEHSDSDDEREENPIQSTSQVGQQSGTSKKTPKQKKPNPYSKIENDESKRKEILETESEEYDGLDDQEHRTQSDWKKSPQWDITYKQQVTASDVFLQMGFKNPGTASCEDMIVTINLPGESRHNIDLNIFKDTLKLVSPNFYLDLPLPHPVDPKRGNAQFEAESEKLIVTLRMDRDLDLVNF
ncbi:unnamed protein product [Phaedon cochleariae]|uniref:PIH1D1/2/3 CS-like domain-containing protein n=1 Tax=Phaedon cochleariae TaxID=80249 RepID=A0A9P0GY55_PHACE|nr:unnamed protein product [Phaedon cochleariae]